MIKLLHEKHDQYGFWYQWNEHRLQGWFTNENIAWYRQMIGGIKGGVIVEVGVYNGASLLSVEDLCQQNGNTFYGYDLWEQCIGHPGPWKHNHTLKRLHAFELTKDLPHVQLQQIASVEAAKLHADQSVGLVFIDAEHTSPSINNDIAVWWPKVRAGGVLSGHDYKSLFPDVVRTVDAFVKVNNLVLQTDTDCWWVQKVA